MQIAVKPSTPAQRLLRSFASVEILPEHRKFTEETVGAEVMAFMPMVLADLLQWGIRKGLARPAPPGPDQDEPQGHIWNAEFVFAAARVHIGTYGHTELPTPFIKWAMRCYNRLDLHDPALEAVTAASIPKPSRREHAASMSTAGVSP